MITSKWYEYSDAYVHVKATIKVPNTASQGTAVNNTNKKLTFQNFAPFTSYMNITNNTQVYWCWVDAQNIDIVIPIYNLIE